MIGISNLHAATILSLLGLLPLGTNLVVADTGWKTKAGGGEEGEGSHAGEETTRQQAGVEVAHERGEPVVHVVDVVGHRQQPESGEDGEEGSHGAGHQQDDHDHHLQNRTYFIVVQVQTCFVTELLSWGAKARKAAAAMRKTRPPVIPSPSTTSYSWL